jgi:dTDP-4-dehydrorhamnose reductase
MRLIVSGASGYLGSQLLLSAAGQMAVVGASPRALPDQWLLDLSQAHLFDADRVTRDDVLVLAAAISSPDICEREHERAWSINVTGSARIIETFLARSARVIFLSSDTVYGEQHDPFDEAQPVNPAGPYGQMKWEVESRFLGDPGFRSLRLSYVFSAADRFTRYLRDCAHKGVEAEIFDPFVRSVVHRQDVVDAVLATARQWPDAPGGVVNVGGPQSLSREAIAQTLRDAAWPRLCFRVVNPDAQFFRNRPRRIAMRSPLLGPILGRRPHTLAEAASKEPLAQKIARD